MSHTLTDQELSFIETFAGIETAENVRALQRECSQLKLDEATLAAILFGEDTAGHGFREIAARVRALLEIAHLADNVVGAFPMIDRQGYELVQPSAMDSLRRALAACRSANAARVCRCGHRYHNGPSGHCSICECEGFVAQEE